MEGSEDEIDRLFREEILERQPRRGGDTGIGERSPDGERSSGDGSFSVLPASQQHTPPEIFQTPLLATGQSRPVVRNSGPEMNRGLGATVLGMPPTSLAPAAVSYGYGFPASSSGTGPGMVSPQARQPQDRPGMTRLR